MGARDDLASYYAARAAEYERIYDKPERQEDLARLRQDVAEFFAGKRVLEVACGTGYWTQHAASRTAFVLATDLTQEVLELARAKPFPAGRVEFHRADAFDLATLSGAFDAALVAFWWSHVKRADLPRFLAGLHERLDRGARVLILDNRYVEGSSTPVSRTDVDGNTYQLRRLSTGEEHEVLKNFPSPGEIRSVLESAGARSVVVEELPYFWLARYST